MSFIDKLLNASRRHESLVCIGLDPDPALLPDGLDALEFGQAIIEATADQVCAFKLNLAFYEALGEEGQRILLETRRRIPEGVLAIGDGKRADIGNSSKAYARALFDQLGFDAITVNPYLGFDALEPFIEYKERGVFVLCRTSNPGSADFQLLTCDYGGKRSLLYEVVAQEAARHNRYGNIGLVVGAAQPGALRNLRKAHPDLPILIPGIGAQGGDLAMAVSSGIDASGERAIICSSRQIIYASNGPDFAQAARRAAKELRAQINACRTGGG